MNSENLTQDPIITRLVTEIQTEGPSPEDVRTAVDRLKRRLGSRLAPGHSQAPPSLRSQGSVATNRWRRPMLRLGIAAAVVGSVIVWQSIPTRQISSGVVFGQVLDAVRQSTSMSYTVIESPPPLGGGDIIQFQVKGSRWLRTVSPGTGVRIADMQDSQMLRFDHPQCLEKHATLYTFVGAAAEMMQAAAGVVTEFNHLLPSDGEPLGNKMIDGQAVTGFRIRRGIRIGDGRGDHSVFDVWADSETAEVVRVDVHHETGEGEGGLTLVDFKFNVEFDDSLFDLQPPPGYTVSYETIDELDPADR